MPMFSAWLTDTGELGALPTVTKAQRAALAWRRINDKPTLITFRKQDGNSTTAQTVRVEWDNTASEAQSEAGRTGKRRVIVFGVRDHPSVTNTDIADGYRFILNGDEYTCIDVLITLGEIQGTFEAVG